MDEALKKEAIAFCQKHPISHWATVEDGVPYVRVMHTCMVEDDFTIWYAVGASSHKVRHVARSPKVSLVFYADNKDAFVLGKAEIVRDAQTKDALWRDSWIHFFPKGKADPEYLLIKITPEKIEYRDLKKHGFKAQKIL
jgi:general stress protein 26